MNTCYDVFNGLELMLGFCIGVFVSAIFVMISLKGDDND